MCRSLKFFVALLAASQATATFAALAKVSSYDTAGQSQISSGVGFATASVSNTRAYVTASAYEYRGGVGVSAFSSTSDKPSIIFNAASADATFSETIKIGQSSNSDFHLFDMGDGTTFELTWAIKPNGNLSTTTATYSGATASYAGANYAYDWSFAGLGGSGFRSEVKSFSLVTTGTDTHSLLGGITYVHLGDVVTLNLHAAATASALALPNAPASASSEFDHTLRWGGVTSIRAFNAQGVEIALPAGFNLALTGADGSSDYFAAAGGNPYLAPVPEPGEWAMMAAGLGVVGAAARRRIRAPGRLQSPKASDHC